MSQPSHLVIAQPSRNGAASLEFQGQAAAFRARVSVEGDGPLVFSLPRAAPSLFGSRTEASPFPAMTLAPNAVHFGDASKGLHGAMSASWTHFRDDGREGVATTVSRDGSWTFRGPSLTLDGVSRVVHLSSHLPGQRHAPARDVDVQNTAVTVNGDLLSREAVSTKSPGGQRTMMRQELVQQGDFGGDAVVGASWEVTLGAAPTPILSLSPYSATVNGSMRVGGSDLRADGGATFRGAVECLHGGVAITNEEHPRSEPQLRITTSSRSTALGHGKIVWGDADDFAVGVKVVKSGADARLYMRSGASSLEIQKNRGAEVTVRAEAPWEPLFAARAARGFDGAPAAEFVVRAGGDAAASGEMAARRFSLPPSPCDPRRATEAPCIDADHADPNAPRLLLRAKGAAVSLGGTCAGSRDPVLLAAGVEGGGAQVFVVTGSSARLAVPLDMGREPVRNVADPREETDAASARWVKEWVGRQYATSERVEQLLSGELATRSWVAAEVSEKALTRKWADEDLPRTYPSREEVAHAVSSHGEALLEEVAGMVARSHAAPRPPPPAARIDSSSTALRLEASHRTAFLCVQQGAVRLPEAEEVFDGWTCDVLDVTDPKEGGSVELHLTHGGSASFRGKEVSDPGVNPLRIALTQGAAVRVTYCAAVRAWHVV